MGFTTGLLGGFTLTATLLYLSTTLHTTNRVTQAALLHQQSLLLDNIIAPQPPPPPPASREVKAGLWETAKDKWNAELEGNVRKLQHYDWNGARVWMEDGVSAVWQRAFRKGREGIEVGVEKGQQGINAGIEKGREGVVAGTEKARDAMK